MTSLIRSPVNTAKLFWPTGDRIKGVPLYDLTKPRYSEQIQSLGPSLYRGFTENRFLCTYFFVTFVDFKPIILFSPNLFRVKRLAR